MRNEGVKPLSPSHPHAYRIFLCLLFSNGAFSALTLLVGRQDGHLACRKTEWWGAGMVICLEQGAELHTAQLMPLPLTVSCASKIQIGFTILVPAHLVGSRRTQSTQRYSQGGSEQNRTYHDPMLTSNHPRLCPSSVHVLKHSFIVSRFLTQFCDSTAPSCRTS